MKYKLSNTVIVSLIYLSVSSPLFAGPVFIGLGNLTGGEFQSFANAISADGTTIVGTSFTSLGQEAFRWTFDGGMISLGELPGGVFGSQANDISADGSIIVGNSGSSIGTEAYRWTAETGMVGLGDLSGGSFFSSAFSISNDGSTIVGDSKTSIYFEAFRWTEQAGMSSIGVLPNYGLSSVANSVSGDGQVIVGEATFEDSNRSGTKAFRWTEETGLQPFLFVEEDSSARAVSTDGSMIVGTIGDIHRGPGFLWLDDGQLFDLGEFVPNAISDDGTVIVGTVPSEQPPSRAIIWDPIFGARDLQSILETDFNLDLEGWELRKATDISADGTMIVGWGINPDGHSEAWLAVVPEPATIVLLSFGLLAVTRRKKSTAIKLKSIMLIGMLICTTSTDDHSYSEFES